MVNRKILGATSTEYNNIKFKSVLECSCYKLLEKSGLDFSYESEKITLWKGVKPIIPIYSPRKKSAGRYLRDVELQTRSLLNITYTPDFKVIKDNYIIYFDVKGKENDVYPVKKKMFIKHLQERNDNHKYMFFEPHSVRQIKQSLDIIKNL